MRNYYIFIGLLGVLVIGVIVTGFILGGTPISQRAIALDKSRLSDFSNIKYKIEDYYRDNKTLPASLSSLKGNLKLQDPETKSNYTYSVTSSTAYKLCTAFSTDSNQEKEDYYNYSTSDKNSHKKGYDCLEYALSDYVINPSGSSRSSPTPTPTINPADYDFLRSCKLEIDNSPSSQIEIMGIYEQEDSVVFTTNKLVNSSIEYWWQDANSPSAAYMYASNIFDTSLSGTKFNKVMGYRIKIFDASGNKENSESYIFQGNRTVIKDPRCISVSSSSG